MQRGQQVGSARAFRISSGVLVTAETLHTGARLYTPMVASWTMMLNRRSATDPSCAAPDGVRTARDPRGSQ